jgi:hypothetical protein
MPIHTQFVKITTNDEVTILEAEKDGAIRNLSIVYPKDNGSTNITLYLKPSKASSKKYSLLFMLPVDKAGFHLGTYYFSKDTVFILHAPDLPDGDELDVIIQYLYF